MQDPDTAGHFDPIHAYAYVSIMLTPIRYAYLTRGRAAYHTDNCVFGQGHFADELTLQGSMISLFLSFFLILFFSLFIDDFFSIHTDSSS